MARNGRSCSSSSADLEDEMKIDFIKAALRREDFFAQSCEVDEDVRKAIEWIAERSASQVRCRCAFCLFVPFSAAG